MSNARDIADAGHQLVAWANFDPNAGSDPAIINKDFGISAINWQAAGKYTVNFDSGVIATGDTSYGVVATAGSTSSESAGYVRLFGDTISYSKTDSQFYLFVLNYNATAYQDFNNISFAVFA